MLGQYFGHGGCLSAVARLALQVPRGLSSKTFETGFRLLIETGQVLQLRSLGNKKTGWKVFPKMSNMCTFVL